MKNLIIKAFTTLLCAVIIVNVKAQINDTLSIPRDSATKPIQYQNQLNPNVLTSCDAPDIRIFPSTEPQSEIHISINKQNPQVLLLSSNTYPYSPTGALLSAGQGAYWSTNGGVNWVGGDVLPNGALEEQTLQQLLMPQEMGI